MISSVSKLMGRSSCRSERACESPPAARFRGAQSRTKRAAQRATPAGAYPRASDGKRHAEQSEGGRARFALARLLPEASAVGEVDAWAIGPDSLEAAEVPGEVRACHGAGRRVHAALVDRAGGGPHASQRPDVTDVHARKLRRWPAYACLLQQTA